MVFSYLMNNLDREKTFYISIICTIIYIGIIFIFFFFTGEKYMTFDDSYKKGICVPGTNAWFIENCFHAMADVLPSFSSVTCYFNKACQILFTEPKKFPTITLIPIYIAVFIIAFTTPTPTNPFPKVKVN